MLRLIWEDSKKNGLGGMVLVEPHSWDRELIRKGKLEQENGKREGRAHSMMCRASTSETSSLSGSGIFFFSSTGSAGCAGCGCSSSSSWGIPRNSKENRKIP